MRKKYAPGTRYVIEDKNQYAAEPTGAHEENVLQRALRMLETRSRFVDAIA